MHILITGGTGLIGKPLVEKLVRDNHQVSILTRNPTIYENIFNTGVHLYEWDGKTSLGWGHLIEHTDAIINLAGENIAGTSLSSILFNRLSRAKKLLILESRVNSGRALVDAIKNANHKPRIFIQASAVGYYGDRSDEVLSESALPGKDDIAQICIQWEDSTSALDELDIRRVIIRTAGLVLSQKGGALPFLSLPFKYYVGGPLGNGKQWVSWIHISDEINAIRFLLQTESAVGVFNLAAPQPLTNKDFSIAIGKALHRPSWLPIPEPVFNIIFGEKAKILLASQKQIPEKLLQLGFEFKYPSLKDALENLLINGESNT